MERPLGVGFMGLGRVALGYHLPALNRHPDIRVMGGADPDPERRMTAARAGVPDPRATLEALLDDSGVEAVLVATPPYTHAAIAMAAVEAGRHVLVEKPVATTPEDALAVADRAAATGRIAVAGHQLRCHPAIEALRRSLDRSELGRIREARARWAVGRERPGADSLLLDLGVHHLDLWPWLLRDEWKELAVVSADDDGQAVEVHGVTRAGVSVTVALTRGEDTTGRAGHRVEIVGAHDRRTVDLYRSRGLVARFRRRDPTRAAFRRQWTRFALSVRDGTPAACSLRDGARAVIAAQTLARMAAGAAQEDIHAV